MWGNFGPKSDPFSGGQGQRPDLCLSFKPSIPIAAKLRRQKDTKPVGTPSLDAILPLDSPSLASRINFARLTVRWGSFSEFASRTNTLRSASLSAIGVGRRPTAVLISKLLLGTPPTRTYFSPQRR